MIIDEVLDSMGKISSLEIPINGIKQSLAAIVGCINEITSAYVETEEENAALRARVAQLENLAAHYAELRQYLKIGDGAIMWSHGANGVTVRQLVSIIEAMDKALEAGGEGGE